MFSWKIAVVLSDSNSDFRVEAGVVAFVFEVLAVSVLYVQVMSLFVVAVLMLDVSLDEGSAGNLARLRAVPGCS